MLSYPPFSSAGKSPTEADLLRAVVARISAETHLSPLGMFTFDEEEEEDEEGGRSAYIPAEEYEGVPKSQLLDGTMSGWAHHVQYILPQGRCKWVNPNPPKDDEGDDDDEEEEEEGPEPETGPPLLTPAQEDEPVDDGSAWSTKLTSSLDAKYAAVVASSNKWCVALDLILPLIHLLLLATEGRVNLPPRRFALLRFTTICTISSRHSASHSRHHLPADRLILLGTRIS